jgi:hypothetical protein
MNYHYRYDHEGNCEIVCTRCFMTIGQARGLASVRGIEAQHQCPSVIEKKQGSSTVDCFSHASLSTTPFLQIKHLFQFLMNAKRLNLPLVRTTAHGIAAALGKIGGFVGVFTFPFFMHWHGLPAAEGAAAIVSGLGLCRHRLPFARNQGQKPRELSEQPSSPAEKAAA